MPLQIIGQTPATRHGREERVSLRSRGWKGRADSGTLHGTPCTVQGVSEIVMQLMGINVFDILSGKYRLTFRILYQYVKFQRCSNYICNSIMVLK